MCSDQDGNAGNAESDGGGGEGALYDLQSVVVHIGEYGSGHYYAYVRPDIRHDVWFRFDDDRMTQVTFQDVADDAYGGKTSDESIDDATQPSATTPKKKRGFLQRFCGVVRGPSYGWGGSTSSAYMLQYVKRTDIEKLYEV